jgi:Ca-activated chloride channel family protein
VAAIERPESTPFVAEIPTAGAGPQSFVRVVATLADGRELEDVELLEGGELREEIDVHLVQLQVLVTDRSGTPVAGLTAEDFRVVDGGESRAIERLYLSRDVALVLGLAIDSSGSMGPLWRRTQGAAERFLDATLGPRDRAFLVDFDDHLRLLQPLTGERSRLYAALGRLQARGGTALYDSILFSMLQFESEPGRRALVVLTDGYDSGSRADPSRAIDFGRRLGVPVYVVALSGSGVTPPGGGALRGPRGRVGGFGDPALARSNLKLITEPTGGRFFQVARPEQVEAVFAQIEAELRNQYVLTYYTDRTPDGRSTPEVEVEGKGLDVKTVVPLDLVD